MSQRVHVFIKGLMFGALRSGFSSSEYNPCLYNTRQSKCVNGYKLLQESLVTGSADMWKNSHSHIHGCSLNSRDELIQIKEIHLF